MTTSNLNQEIKQLIVDALQLEGVDPARSRNRWPVRIGLDLDSIDALELATAVAKKYNIDVRQDDETRNAFRSVQHLADFITLKRGR